MTIFSKRNKPLPDVYRYDHLPPKLKIQIVLIWQGIAKSLPATAVFGDQIFGAVKGVLCKEYGLFGLTSGIKSDEQEVVRFFLDEKNVEKCLDVIEVVFSRLFFEGHEVFEDRVQIGIEELNHRFREHGIGYELKGGQIIRVDSKFAHSEIVTPVLKILEDNYLKGANAEFLKAHEHYRSGDYKESINECLKAFESTMKAICHKHNWHYNQDKDDAKKLIGLCQSNGLFPQYNSNHLHGLVQTLESGVPTMRNKTSGHGQGAILTIVSEETVSYVLHLTAANILFLASAEKNLDGNKS